MPDLAWPPADTDRNRFLFRLGAVLGALASVYFLLFALQTGGLVPWAITAVLLAATLVLGAGLLLMRAHRSAVAAAERRVDAGADGTPAP